MRRFLRMASAAGLMIAVVNLSGASGQAPIGAPPPGAPATPAGVTPGAAPPPAAGVAPKAGFFARLCAGLDACRRKICATPAGQLINSMTKPVTAFSGGVIPPFCPIMPSAKDLEKAGVGGAAAAAQKDALEAKERRAAVRFLGTLDCRYYPDAAPALAAALRTDGSECVRYEAALVLNRGCCCTEFTIKALEASVSGTEMDGAPAERSVRVRCAAALALEHCLACYVAPPVDVEPIKKDGEKPPVPGEVGPPSIDPNKKPMPGDTLPPPNTLPLKKDDTARPTVANRLPSRDTVDRARKTLNEFNALLAAAAPPMVARPGIPTAGRQSVYQLLKESAGETPLVYPTANPPPFAAAPPAPPSPLLLMSPPSPAGPATVAGPKSFAGPSATLAPPRTVVPPPAVPPTVEPPAAPVAPPMMMPMTPPVSMPREPAFIPATATMPPATLPVLEDPATEWGKKVLQAPTAAERHTAIRQLVRQDWRQHPVVASVLLVGAKGDPTPAVRVDCLRHLAAYKVNHPQVLAEVAVLTGDSDTWVRQEAAQALEQLRQNP